MSRLLMTGISQQVRNLQVNIDVTPDPLSWTALLSSSTSEETITGISSFIVLYCLYSLSGEGFFQYILNGTPAVTVSSGETFIVNLNDTLAFTMQGPGSFTVSVYNQSDGDALLDSFTISGITPP